MKYNNIEGKNRVALEKMETIAVLSCLLFTIVTTEIGVAMKTKIYVLQDELQSVRYIGKTVKTLQKRLEGHLDEARRRAKNYRCNWIRSMLSRGCTPSIILIEKYNGNGNKEEIAWIKYFRELGTDLTNGTEGGTGGATFLGRHHTEEAKKGISKHHRSDKGMKGLHHSKKTIKKMSLAKQGKKCSEEHKRNMSIVKKGTHHTEETKKKMRLAHKNVSIETRKKISLARKGHSVSPETRRKIAESNREQERSAKVCEKMSKSHIGLKASTETRKKMSESGKRAWKKRKIEC